MAAADFRELKVEISRAGERGKEGTSPSKQAVQRICRANDG